ncbi:hypothetical protein BVG79_02249 [Ketogulonicigenium robustum]|uniref:Uncharacterized protein n=1 Tax=Ketogulonicigenium robustum TaxID=92947 RepID=A0A1W6P2D6_9RHOB|nr:hypothetical protein BVG79_02249 [Ketogulonicigenium robustum]
MARRAITRKPVCEAGYFNPIPKAITTKLPRRKAPLRS